MGPDSNYRHFPPLVTTFESGRDDFATHEIVRGKNAWDRIRTGGPLQDSALNAAPLAWLGYPRPACTSSCPSPSKSTFVLYPVGPFTSSPSCDEAGEFARSRGIVLRACLVLYRWSHYNCASPATKIPPWAAQRQRTLTVTSDCLPLCPSGINLTLQCLRYGRSSIKGP